MRSFEIVHPEYKHLENDEAATPVEETLTPVYPTTEGLRQISLRNLTEQALVRLKRGTVEELVPEEFLPQSLYTGRSINLNSSANT